MPNTIKLTHLYGTPVFSVVNFDLALKRVYGATYIKELGVFVFPAFYPFHALVKHDLGVVFEDHELEWSPEALAQISAEDAKEAFISGTAYNPDFKFITKPYQHQVDAFVFGLYNARCGLLLDPGLGKTKIAIDIMRYQQQFLGGTTALVLVPLVILHKWAEEVAFHSGGELTPVVVDGTPKQKRAALARPGDVYITTYHTAASLADDIIDAVAYNTIIADESHNLQSPSSEKTKAATHLSRKAFRRIIMSGTAALGDPRHLWGQLDLLGPFLHEKDLFKFNNRYIQYAAGRKGPDGKEQKPKIPQIIGYKNLDILHARLARVSIRRKKEQCLDLPPRVFSTIPYSITKEQRTAYNDLIQSSKSELSEKLRVIGDAVAATRLIKLAQILSGYLVESNKDPNICDGCSQLRVCATNKISPYTKHCMVAQAPPASTLRRFKTNPKIDALSDLLDIVLDNQEDKTIIWAHYLEELNLIEQLLELRSDGCVRVDGAVSGGEVQARVKKFQTDPKTRVSVGQIASGVGIDLTAANSSIYFSLDWSLGSYLQSIDRNYRIGQTRSVTVYTLLLHGSIEEAVYQALQNKEDISQALTDKAPDKYTVYERLIAHPKVL